MQTSATAPFTRRHLAALAVLLSLGAGAISAREGYFEQYCSAAGCHTGATPSGSTTDSPSCAACHYHGMKVVRRRWKEIPTLHGWTDQAVYSAGETIQFSVTGGDQPGWVRVRITDQNGREVARATGPTGMGDDLDPNWTASVLPGPIVLTARAPYTPGEYAWKVGWFGNVAYPNPPEVLAGQTLVAHRSFVLDWHDVQLPAFKVTSSDATGPSVGALTVTPTPTGGAAEVRVTALATDDSSGMTPIREARARIIGGAPGGGAAWAGLQAADGLFDTLDEQVTGVLKVASLAPGSYSVQVQAADMMGNWGGAVQSTFFATAPPAGDTSLPLATCSAPQPEIVPPGQPLTLRAFIDDRATGGSPVYGAEAFLTSPGQDGTGESLVAADSLLDSPFEEMTGFFTTAGLADGEYQVLIHGLDAAGLWGAYCPIAFEIRQSADMTGPSAADLAFTPTPTMGAAVAILHARASDLSSGHGAITAAEFIFAPGETPGTGIPMQATDGIFDSPAESVIGVLAVNGLEPGAYLSGVRARDQAGNWGPVSWASLLVSHSSEDRSGPVVLGLKVTPAFSGGAATTVLSGRLDDSRSGASQPALIEYYLESPGLAGSGILVPVTPTPGRAIRAGRHPGSSARFESPIDVRALATDRSYPVYVRGMDEHGNWGPLAATAFRVTAAH